MNSKQIMWGFATTTILGGVILVAEVKHFAADVRRLRTESAEADNISKTTDLAVLSASCRQLLNEYHHCSATMVSATYAKLFPDSSDSKEQPIGTNAPPAILALDPAVIEIARAQNTVVLRLRPHTRNCIMYLECNTITNELWYFDGGHGYILLRREPDNNLMRRWDEPSDVGDLRKDEHSNGTPSIR